MIYILIMALHFLFDWVLQPIHIAKLKGPSREGINAVVYHIAFNIVPFTVIFVIILLNAGVDFYTATAMGFINLFSHAIIDTWLPKGNNERQMVNWTVVDQILHLGILFFIITKELY